MPKLENHDVFHLITETGTEISDEISMQYLLFGNGKLKLVPAGDDLYRKHLCFRNIAHIIGHRIEKGRPCINSIILSLKAFLNESTEHITTITR